MDNIHILLIYLSVVSIISVCVTVYDKIAAKHFTKHRVRESHLLFLSAIGGAAAMFAAMVIIRHKTQKPKFMISIPLMIVLQLVIALLLYAYR